MSSLKHTAKSFDSHGTEGMLDVILACTLIFILLTSLVQAGRAQAQEKTLPAMNLSKSSPEQAGSQQVSKTSISIKRSGDEMKLYLDSEAVSFETLKSKLQNLSGVGQIALRRDKDIPCAWEDKLIILCQETGIDRVSIVVATEK
jgi:biopolymer transport protein ExbD